ncbi:rhodanese-like domain-containing protein [Portibacter marinus]|uniref:rhodanese-like domain-containing protein n=1 Tax=Portibacter marinus TaxID=2898660 RepID=UPI001F2DB9DB|nr:rhodanese-like domain-containing protein [Portibacter marinus]
MDIQVEELKDKLDAKDDFILIDVREDYERAEFHVGGDHIPLGTLPANLEDYEDAKEKEIVVYCRSGNRSGQAKAFMEQMGFKNVRNLVGGMLEWNRKGL